MKTLCQAKFLGSAIGPNMLGYDYGMEFAFVGRSNSGKSTVINTLCGQRSLAHSSSRPGKTRYINLFSLDKGNYHRLSDLPGYGYARRAQSEQQLWRQEITAYILERKSLCGIVIVMDIRHPFTKLDKKMLELASSRKCLLHILLNKSDKINRSQEQKTVSNSRHMLENMLPKATLSGFTSKGGSQNSCNEFRKILQDWLKGTFQSKIGYEKPHNRRDKALW